MDMLNSYWERVSKQRVTRRRALAASSGGMLGLTLLAGCGGDGSAGVEGDASGLVVNKVDTSKQAKRGGIMKRSTDRDAAHLDVHQAVAPLCLHKDHVYSRLMRKQPGYLKEAEYDFIGDLAESFEYSPDHLSMTLKLRPGLKWHNKPPINGRALDAEDVLFSWERVSRTSSQRVGFVNSANPDAPLLGFSAPDARTIVVKVKYPVSYLPGILARTTTGYLHMVPKETDSTFNIRNDMIGTGPYVLEKYSPSVGLFYKRFADYYDKERPYVDGTDVPIISEYAAGLAQFKAGNIYTFDVRPEDILTIKRENPELDLYQTDVSAPGTLILFGLWPSGKGVFLDERVRRAYSMSIDRDLFIDTFYNVSKNEAEGLPIDTKWSSNLQQITEGWWLDPQDRDTFGPNAQYFQYNVAEAKKLLAAAGYPNGVEIDSWVPHNGFGATYLRQIEVVEGFHLETGFKIRKNLIDYTTEWIPKYRQEKGNFAGLTYTNGPGPADDPVAQSIFEFHPQGSANFIGFDATGKGDNSGDPQVTSILEKARGEFNTERRKLLVHEFQRYVAGKMYGLRFGGGASGFALRWPAVQNYDVFRGDNRPHFYEWLDTTKPPFTKA